MPFILFPFPLPPVFLARPGNFPFRDTRNTPLMPCFFSATEWFRTCGRSLALKGSPSVSFLRSDTVQTNLTIASGFKKTISLTLLIIFFLFFFFPLQAGKEGPIDRSFVPLPPHQPMTLFFRHVPTPFLILPRTSPFSVARTSVIVEFIHRR